MSSQGTGSITQYGFERQLLDCWGLWARSGGTDTGISRVDLLKKGGVGLLFGDGWMMATDAVVASLPIDHKRTLKKVYLSRRGLLLPQSQKDSAISEFARVFSETIDNQSSLA